MGKNYWMIVETYENFQITKDMNSSLLGVGPKYKKRAQRMQPLDRVLFYIKNLRKWTATATIASHSFQDRTPIWKPIQKDDHLIYRVKINVDLAPIEEDYIDALFLAPTLDYVKRWAPEYWPLAFQDRLHLLPQRDFKLIENEMSRNMKARFRHNQTEITNFNNQQGKSDP